MTVPMRAGCKLSVGNIRPAPSPPLMPSAPAMLAVATCADDASVACAASVAPIAPSDSPTSAPPPALRPPSQRSSNMVGASVPISVP